MKTLIKMACIALALLLSSTGFAQDQRKQRGSRDSAWAKMSERLQLSNDQQTKLKSVLKQNKTEMKTLRESLKTATKEERKKAVIAQLQKNDERVNAILNEKQRAEFKKIKEEKKAAMKKHKKRSPKDNPEEGDAEDILEEGIL